MTASGKGLTEQGRRVAAHWSRLALTYEGAVQTLEARGIAPADATAETLHGIDMIHMGGLAATDALAGLAGIAPGQRVLDVGSGVGGPARRVADRFGAEVTGVELSETLYGTAVRLTDMVGLSDRVRFLNASALALPVEDGAFDVVMMTHVAMQISEKAQLFAELTRAVRPGGCLALHEIFAGEGELEYPLAWAMEPSMSALEPFADCAARLAVAGFEVGDFIDHSADGAEFHRRNIAAWTAALARGEGAGGLPPEALEVRLATSKAMESNLSRGSLRVGMVLARKA